jgi:hypothetical protein
MFDADTLDELVRALRQLASAIEELKPSAKPVAQAGAKLKLSPERRESLRWQGRYMAAVKVAKPREAARLRAMYARRGPRAAVLSRTRS